MGRAVPPPASRPAEPGTTSPVLTGEDLVGGLSFPPGTHRRLLSREQPTAHDGDATSPNLFSFFLLFFFSLLFFPCFFFPCFFFLGLFPILFGAGAQYPPPPPPCSPPNSTASTMATTMPKNTAMAILMGL